MLSLPSDGGSGPPRLSLSSLLPFPPLPDSPGFPVPYSSPFSSLYTLLPIRPCHFVAPPPPPPQQRLIPRHPSGGFLRRPPPVDATQINKCQLRGSGAPRFWCVTALCGWWYLDWVWVEGRRRRRPLRLSLSFRVDRLFAGQMATVFMLNSLSRTAFVNTLPRQSFLNARLSLPPPPPLPLSTYNRTCPTTLPTNGRVVSWAFLNLHPAGPGLPVGFRRRSPSLSSPPPPYSMALIIRVR